MPSNSPRQTFERHLQALLDQVLIMSSMVEDAMRQALAALKHSDLTAARQIYAADERINERRFALENEIVTLIATQQPMARDVRFLVAIFEIITELERIGDYAKGICKITLLIGAEPVYPTIMADLTKMNDLGLDMLRRALDAFMTFNATAAACIPAEDDVVDGLYNQIYRELMINMKSDITTIELANYLLWAAHNLERMADRVTNICERIVYVATGEIHELDVKHDPAS